MIGVLMRALAQIWHSWASVCFRPGADTGGYHSDRSVRLDSGVAGDFAEDNHPVLVALSQLLGAACRGYQSGLQKPLVQVGACQAAGNRLIENLDYLRAHP